jgi:hypothetical protein
MMPNNTRKIEDTDLTKKAIRMTSGKRWMYQQPIHLEK